MNTATFAPIVRRRTSTWPSKMASYFDCTAFGSGFFRCGRGPGAIALNKVGQMMDIITGKIYYDVRFDETMNQSILP